LIERFFNKIKQCRCVATRYDKLAANYLAFIKLASIRLLHRPKGLFSCKLFSGNPARKG
jgi:transposase